MGWIEDNADGHDFWMLMNDPEHEAKQEAAQVIARLNEVIDQPISSFELSPLSVVLLSEVNGVRAFGRTTAYRLLQEEQMRQDAIMDRRRIERHKAVNCGRAMLVWLALSAMFAVSVWLMFRGGN